MKKVLSRGGQQGRDDSGANQSGDAGARKKSLLGRIRRGLWSGEEGNALVELAFVAPIVMLLLTGVASFSMALYSYQQLG
jgi:hypothetical protein